MQSERDGVGAQCVLLDHLRVGVVAQCDGGGPHRGLVQLNGDDAARALGQLDGERADAGADLEHLVAGGELQRVDDAQQRVAVDQEVLAKSVLQRQAGAPGDGAHRRRVGEVEGTGHAHAPLSTSPTGNANRRRALAVAVRASAAASALRNRATTAQVAAT